MIRGVDLSKMQGKVSEVILSQTGIRFAYIRASVGNDGPDPMFAVNCEAAKAAGLKVGAYHAAYPLPHLDPEAQAIRAFNACSGLGSRPGELPPAVDLEWPARENAGKALGSEWRKWGCTAPQIRAWALAYAKKAKEVWGVTPVLYTYPWWWKTIEGYREKAFGDFLLWMADYSHFVGKVPGPEDAPAIPEPWDKWTFWQHDGDLGLRLPSGVDADFNVFNGDEDAFAGLLREPVIGPDNQPVFCMPDLEAIGK